MLSISYGLWLLNDEILTEQIEQKIADKNKYQFYQQGIIEKVPVDVTNKMLLAI